MPPLVAALVLLVAPSAQAQAPWGGYRVVERGPADATWAVVFLHGDGAPPDDFVALADELLAHGVVARFVIPDGSRRGSSAAWFSDDASLTAACHAMDGVVTTLRGSGVAPEHVIVAGFSKGATLAYVFGAVHHGPLGGLVIASGFPLPLPRRILRGLRGRAVFHSHGRGDAQIEPALGVELGAQLAAAGAVVSELEFDGGHEMVPWAVEAFLRDRMGMPPPAPQRIQ